MISKKEKIVYGLSYIIYALIALLVFLKGIQTTNDSASYIGMSSMRSPVYPLLIKLFYFMGGIHYQLWLLCFQILFGALGVYVFCSFIHKFFKLEFWLTFLLSIFLLAPYFIFGNIANVVMTEAIAYPLFLIAIRFLIEAVYNKSIRPFVIYMICCIPLIMTRGQFLFLYLISGGVIFYLLFSLKEKRNKLLSIIIIFIASIIFTNLAERTYNYLLFHHFNKVSLVGLQLSATGFYLSDNEDIKLFQDSTEIKLFERVQLITHIQNNWNLKYDKKKEGNSGFGYYQQVYNDIIWNAIYPEAIKIVPKSDAFNDMSAWIFINTLTKSVSKKLIKQHWKEFVRMYATNVLYGLGYRHYSLLFILLFFIFIVLSIRFHNSYGVLFILLLSLCLINIVLVALVEPTGEYRYLIYNDFLYFTIMVLSVNNWILGIKRNQNTPDAEVV